MGNTIRRSTFTHTPNMPPAVAPVPLADRPQAGAAWHSPTRQRAPAATQPDALPPRTALPGGPAQPAGAATTWRSGLSEDECGRVGVAQWPDARPDGPDAARQAAYGKSFAVAVDAAAQDIAAGRLPDLASVWKRATQWRVRQVPPGDSQDRALMKRRRVFHPLSGATDHTPLVDRYRYVIDRARVSPQAVTRPGFAGRADVELTELTSRAALGGREVALTSVLIPCLAQAGRHEVARETAWLQPMIAHTTPQLLDEILAHVQHLTTQLRPSAPLAQRLEQLGAIHWWLAQAMPDSRGSAAKAEFCVRAYAGAAGVSLPPFGPGRVPDIEAFLTPLETYRGSYGAYFARPPAAMDPPASGMPARG